MFSKKKIVPALFFSIIIMIIVLFNINNTSFSDFVKVSLTSIMFSLFITLIFWKYPHEPIFMSGFKGSAISIITLILTIIVINLIEIRPNQSFRNGILQPTLGIVAMTFIHYILGGFLLGLILEKLLRIEKISKYLDS